MRGKVSPRSTDTTVEGGLPRPALQYLLQSPAGPKAGYYSAPRPCLPITVRVSIPSRPESRLLRPEQRAMRAGRGYGFNPQPARKPAATRPTRARRRSGRGFNPQPARKPAATPDDEEGRAGVDVSIPSRPESRLLLSLRDSTLPATRFQSPVGPKAGCYAQTLVNQPADDEVSIPSRPESRLLLDRTRHRRIAMRVSIPSRPESRLLHVQPHLRQRGHAVSIPSRPESRLLRARRRDPALSGGGFNPQSARKPAATPSS